MKKTILYCEDDILLAQMYKIKLEQAGFSVVVKHNAIDAIDWLKTHRPAVAIVDIVLPKVNGITLIKTIRMDERLKNTKIIVHTNLSPSSTNFAGSAAESLGVESYLLKSSTTPGQLVEAANHMAYQQ